jgi:hypothetical protein
MTQDLRLIPIFQKRIRYGFGQSINCTFLIQQSLMIYRVSIRRKNT